jgi:hypothetical protein
MENSFYEYLGQGIDKLFVWYREDQCVEKIIGAIEVTTAPN